MNLPLRGIRVLDMTRILAGPFCTMLLGDLGADVIKVEHPKTGDDTRSWGPPFSAAGEQSAYFLGVNRNKRSIAVDLKSESGVALIHQLAAKSDIVVENFVPGKADSLGVGYASLKTTNNKLIYASLSGYGSEGPRSSELAYDVMISAIGGLMGITGTESGEVCKVGVAITDVCAGLVTQGAILAALIHVLRGGDRQWVETSLLATQIAALANVASAYLVSGVVTKPQGTAHSSIVPYQRFTTKEGNPIIVGALNDKQFVRLCAAISMESLGVDPRFVSNKLRVQHRGILIPVLQERVGQLTQAEIIHLLNTHEVPCAPVNPIDSVFNDPQVKHTERVITAEHPTVGLLKMVANPATFHGTPLVEVRPPPLLGQHTSEILTELLDVPPTFIKDLERKGVIHQWR